MDNNFSERCIGYVKEREKILGLPDGFIIELLNEEREWIKVISFTTFVETLMGEFIERNFDKKMIRFLRNKKCLTSIGNKTDLLNETTDIPKSYIEFAKGLASIRNRCSHNIKNINFSLCEHISSMKNNKQIVEQLTFAITEDEDDKYHFIMNYPYLCILCGVILWASVIHLMIERVDLSEKLKRSEESIKTMQENIMALRR